MIEHQSNVAHIVIAHFHVSGRTADSDMAAKAVALGQSVKLIQLCINLLQTILTKHFFGHFRTRRTDNDVPFVIKGDNHRILPGRSNANVTVLFTVPCIETEYRSTADNENRLRLLPRDAPVLSRQPQKKELASPHLRTSVCANRERTVPR